jgi:hypothetical protein
MLRRITEQPIPERPARTRPISHGLQLPANQLAIIILCPTNSPICRAKPLTTNLSGCLRVQIVMCKAAADISNTNPPPRGSRGPLIMCLVISEHNGQRVSRPETTFGYDLGSYDVRPHRGGFLVHCTTQKVVKDSSPRNFFPKRRFCAPLSH